MDFNFKQRMQKILLVDDREDNLFSMETILEPDGYIFIKANSGRQALKILMKEFDFALILMDVKMPNLNGLETAELIYERDKLKHIPIIFITANTYGDDNVFKGYRVGAVDYISKPINPGLLRAKVAVFIDLYKKNHLLIAQEQKLKIANAQLQLEIEERKKTAEEIVNLNVQLLDNIQQLKTTNEELDHFAFIASHDLQEPLRKIRTFIDILRNTHSKQINADAGECLKKIERSADRMHLLINDILTFSRFSNNQERFVNTNLDETLQESLSDLEIIIHEKKAIIKKTALPTLTVVPSMMIQLFQNLLSNALKFSKKNVQPEVEIFCNKIKGNAIPNINSGLEENEYYAISFKDNGIGFDEEYTDKIFVIFKRLHSNYDFEGTGIGLAICKKIADKHSGFIYANSKMGEQSTFTVALPVAV